MSGAYKQLEQTASDLGLTVDFEFVPQRFADGTKMTDMGLKWIVNVYVGGKKLVLRTTYTQGVAHCPSYKHHGMTVADYENVRSECLNGPRSGQPAEPLDALWCIARDCQGVNQSSGFEDWAKEFGYDPDSRKAEGIYREVQKQFMSLRYYIGDAGIDALANVDL